MPIDIERERSLTAACQHVVHFNNAGASPSPVPVLDATIGHLRREAEIGGYEAANEASDRTKEVYASVARLVNGAPDEVALIDNATRAWDMAFYGLQFGPGDRILTGRAEYASNAIAMLQVAARTGATVELIDDDEHGQISVEQLADRIDDRAKLIALTHVPTNGGLVNPAEAVGRIAKAAGVPYLLDACQAAGQIALDVEAIGCDVLAATGRKFLRGPRGTGFAWVRRDFIEQIDPPLLDLHAARWTSPDTYEVCPDARRLETWESSVACRLGLGAAIDHALDLGIDQIEARVVELASSLRDQLTSIPGVTVQDKGERRYAIVTFTVDAMAPGEVSEQLRAHAINTSVTHLDSAQFDLPFRGLGDLVRASVHYFNTDDELDHLIGSVATLARG